MSANEARARSLLNRIPALQRPCDLDVLVFFARHPRTLLASDQLARLLGYHLTHIVKSLDVLMAADLLTAKSNPERTVRLYVFAKNGTNDDWLPAFVELASSRDGRLALRLTLTRFAGETHGHTGDATRG